MTSQDTKVRIQYAALQLPFWMGYSAIINFASVYLILKSFKTTQVGIILALANLIAALLQPLSASFADRTQRISLSQMVMILCVCMMAAAGWLRFGNHNQGRVMVLYGTIIVLLQLILPLIYSIAAFFISRGYSINYGAARGIGSLSYALASKIIGGLIEKYTEDILPLIIMIMFGILFAMTVFLETGKSKVKILREEDPARWNPGKEQNAASAQAASLYEFARENRFFVVMTLGIMLIFIFDSLHNSYMLQILQQFGGTVADAGNVFFYLAVMELPVMFGSFLLLRKFGADRLMMFSGIFFLAKAIVIMSARNMMMIYLAETLHALGPALYTAISVNYVNEVIAQKDQVKGQSVLISAMTAGGIIGTLLGGILLDVSGVGSMLKLGTLVTGVGSVMMIAAIRHVSGNVGIRERARIVRQPFQD